jgi:hypothetical protein
VNLGQACAKQGQHKIAVACLASGYRFSKNKTATRQFLQKLADDEDEDAAVRKAARQTFQLPLVQAQRTSRTAMALHTFDRAQLATE